MITIIIVLLGLTLVLLYLLYTHAEETKRKTKIRFSQVRKEEEQLQQLKDIGKAEEIKIKSAKLYNQLIKLQHKVKSTLNKNKPSTKPKN